VRALVVALAFALLADVAGTERTASAEPSDRHLVYAGLGMALPDYMLGVTLHEGSHALAARLYGAHVTSLHLWPGHNPSTGHFQFGWTRVTGLGGGRGRQIVFLVAPKITDALMLTGFGILYAADALPSNRWGWLTVQVLATGFWVDFAKDVLVFHRFNDVVRIFDLLDLDTEWKRLPLRLAYAALDVGAGALVYLGWRDLFRADDDAVALPLLGGRF
jgi:hypothetical protein